MNITTALKSRLFQFQIYTFYHHHHHRHHHLPTIAEVTKCRRCASRTVEKKNNNKNLYTSLGLVNRIAKRKNKKNNISQTWPFTGAMDSFSFILSFVPPSVHSFVLSVQASVCKVKYPFPYTQCNFETIRPSVRLSIRPHVSVY